MTASKNLVKAKALVFGNLSSSSIGPELKALGILCRDLSHPQTIPTLLTSLPLPEQEPLCRKPCASVLRAEKPLGTKTLGFSGQTSRHRGTRVVFGTEEIHFPLPTLLTLFRSNHSTNHTTTVIDYTHKHVR